MKLTWSSVTLIESFNGVSSCSSRFPPGKESGSGSVPKGGIRRIVLTILDDGDIGGRSAGYRFHCDSLSASLTGRCVRVLSAAVLLRIRHERENIIERGITMKLKRDFSFSSRPQKVWNLHAVKVVYVMRHWVNPSVLVLVISIFQARSASPPSSCSSSPDLI